MKVVLLVNKDNYERYSSWDDVSWELIHIGNDAPPDASEVIATEADVLIVDAIMKIKADIISNMPSLKLIHSLGVAFNGIDIDAARSAGVYVCNNAGVNAYPVAEHAVLLILALLKRFRLNEDMVYENRQMEAKKNCFMESLPELGSLRVGIIGFGAIGNAVASVLKPFGCEVCYFTRRGDVGFKDVRYLPLEELYATCDIVLLSAPVTSETENMINNESLKLFKSGAILINMARGELMDHQAVADAIISGKLSGFGSDVLAPEPYLPDNPILMLPKELRSRVAITPHTAGITGGTFVRSYERIKKNIEVLASGQKPDCVVNGL